MRTTYERYYPDLEAYRRRTRSGPCFICKIVTRDPDFPTHHIVYEDATAIAFLNRYPTQYGYTLVTTKGHKERVTGDFSVEEYLSLQRLVHRVTEAVREEVGAERVYLYTFGSNQGNAYVHWHVVPLSRGVPYDQQQFAVVMVETTGILRSLRRR